MCLIQENATKTGNISYARVIFKNNVKWPNMKTVERN